MKKILRAIVRLFVAGAVGAGALFAAVKVGPRVVSKVGPLLHRAPPPDDEGDPIPISATASATDDEPHRERHESAAPAESAPSDQAPSDHPAPDRAPE